MRKDYFDLSQQKQFAILEVDLAQGAITQGQIDLASLLGHIPAQMLATCPEPPTTKHEWSYQVGRYGSEACLRVGLIAALIALEHVREKNRIRARCAIEDCFEALYKTRNEKKKQSLIKRFGNKESVHEATTNHQSSANYAEMCIDDVVDIAQLHLEEMPPDELVKYEQATPYMALMHLHRAMNHILVAKMNESDEFNREEVTSFKQKMLVSNLDGCHFYNHERIREQLLPWTLGVSDPLKKGLDTLTKSGN